MSLLYPHCLKAWFPVMNVNPKLTVLVMRHRGVFAALD